MLGDAPAGGYHASGNAAYRESDQAQGKGPRCQCQNQQILGRGAQAVRLRINGNRKLGDTMFTQIPALLKEVKPYSFLIIIDECEYYKS